MEKLREEEGNAFMEMVESKLEDEAIAENVHQEWNHFKNILVCCAKETIGIENGKKVRKPWVTESMLKKMKERRKWKK